MSIAEYMLKTDESKVTEKIRKYLSFHQKITAPNEHFSFKHNNMSV